MSKENNYTDIGEVNHVTTATERKARMLSAEIPFQGFYNTLWSDLIDQAVEQYLDYDGDGEVDAGENWFDHIDYSGAHKYFAQQYVEAYADYLSEQVGFKVEFEFEEMTSPRFYNYDTDRVFAKISIESAGKLLAFAKSDGAFDSAIGIRFTNRSGFISSYSNQPSEWAKKPLARWDHNEIGTILAAIVPSHDPDLNLYYHVSEYVRFDESVDQFIDYDKLEVSYFDWEESQKNEA